MQVTGMLTGARLLAHVGFPTSEILGPDATEDQIQGLIDRHGLIFIKPLFRGGVGRRPVRITFDMKLALGQVITPGLFNRMLKDVSDDTEKALIMEAVLRSQTQAYYGCGRRPAADYIRPTHPDCP